MDEENEEWIPLVSVLMRDGQLPSYQKAFELIDSEWTTGEIERIHMDYEKAEMSGAEKIWGDDKIYGCLFHFTRAALLI